VVASLCELAALVLDFVEQSHVLDGDHRLIGEGRNQLNLLGSEWTHGTTRESNHSNRGSVAEQRYAKHGTVTAEFLRFGQLVLGISLRIEDLHSRAFKQSSTGHALPPRFKRCAFKLGLALRGKVIVCKRLKEARVVRTSEVSDVCLAQSGSRLDQSVEYGLEVEGRAADDLEYIGSGGLLLQRFAQLVEQPRVLDGDDGLVGEVREKLDLPVCERADLLAIDDDCAEQRPSLSIGTATSVLAPATKESCGRLKPGFRSKKPGSLSASAICAVCFVAMTRPRAVLGPGRRSPALRISSSTCRDTPLVATMRTASPSLK
jgi:hypothetical protein